jgi:acyl dehydratase
MPRYFDDVDLGDELGPLETTATDASVREFCEVWGNPGPSRFTDHEAARKEGLAGAIIPGVMSMALLSQLLTRWAEGGSMKKLDVVFRQLVPHNVPLRIVGVVTDKNQVKGENLVDVDVYLENGQGDRMVGGKATLSLPRRE